MDEQPERRLRRNLLSVEILSPDFSSDVRQADEGLHSSGLPKFSLAASHCGCATFLPVPPGQAGSASTLL
jgi:hypothetical protein